jgi:uncharacterized protein YwgA
MATSSTRLKRNEWLLFLLGSEDTAGRRPTVIDRVRIMKCLFVIAKSLPDAIGDDYYNFRAYDYGPFDSTVYSDAEALCAAGLAEEVRGRYVAYAATPAGIEKAKELATRIPAQVKEYVHQVRAWATAVDFNTLIRAIYQRWPEMKASSVFRG